jgi:serine/threonine protein kinase
MSLPSFYSSISNVQVAPAQSNLPITATTHQSEETINKSNKVGLKAIWQDFKELARGAIKVVWVQRSQIAASGMDLLESVYYTPVKSFFGGNARELKREVQKMKDIEEKLKADPTSATYLAIDAEVLPKAERIQSKYTIKTPAASTDFEKKISNPETSMNDRALLGGHLLAGLTGLHKAGYVHGDMKPENCLIYQGGKLLKLADFGKAEMIKDKASQKYSGNTRFAPPEGQLSKKSDVYGAAMMLIRNFEEPFLSESELSLVPIDSTEKDMDASSDLRGVERFVVENKSFLAANAGSKTSLWTRIIRRFQMGRRSTEEKNQQTQAMHQYIDQLKQKLEEKEGFSPVHANRLCDLLKKMTVDNPTERISAEDASKEYDLIFQDRPE